jgi:Na+-transporting methylmalonyl-CoA/oxaloacetate decarboxylase gamma subunit
LEEKMKKNYKKIVVVLLSLMLISFGVMGALAAENTPAPAEQTTTAEVSQAPQTDAGVTQAPAAEVRESGSKRWGRLLRFIVNAIILGIVGILLLIIGYYIWEMITVNYSVREQLVDHKNTAVAIVTASFVLGMAIVIGIALTKI